MAKGVTVGVAGTSAVDGEGDGALDVQAARISTRDVTNGRANLARRVTGLAPLRQVTLQTPDEDRPLARQRDRGAVL